MTLNRSNDEIKFLSQAEIQKLFDKIEKSKQGNQFRLRDLAMFHIAYYCGLRAGELGAIKYNDYSQDTGEIRLKRLKGSYNNTIKLDQKRKLKLNDYLRKFTNFGGKEQRLFHIHSEYDALFKTKFGVQMNTRAVEMLFDKYITQTNIPEDKHHPHVLKHSIAVHLAESGLDIKEVQSWLGHKNTKNTEIYFQFTTHQQEQLYRKLGQSNRIA